MKLMILVLIAVSLTEAQQTQKKIFKTIVVDPKYIEGDKLVENIGH